jgi:hypothetical protein
MSGLREAFARHEEMVSDCGVRVVATDESIWLHEQQFV